MTASWWQGRLLCRTRHFYLHQQQSSVEQKCFFPSVNVIIIIVIFVVVVIIVLLQLYDTVRRKMSEMQLLNMSWVEVQFLNNAVNILCQCRQTLMYTYVFAYYLRKNNQSIIFEVLCLCGTFASSSVWASEKRGAHRLWYWRKTPPRFLWSTVIRRCK